MGAFTKFIDAVLFLAFLLLAVVAPLLDGQTCFPESLYPDALVDLKQWYAREFGDYLVTEKPAFFVGVVWVELLFQWPLSILSLYGILASKCWYNTTCLMYGVSVFTSMCVLLAEMNSSGKASEKLMQVYYPFLGISILAILRGLVPRPGKTSSTIGMRPAMARKKRA